MGRRQKGGVPAWGAALRVPSPRDPSGPELHLPAGGGRGGGREAGVRARREGEVGGGPGCALRSLLAPPPPPHTLGERERGADAKPPGCCA